ncbi:NADP-dependent oxidoreductase domain-containing protein [Mycena metata]|uniref:NADP-dependent oxidoreductase domain-containing protein n=1 Tax=Mycena metata TaxID=1033252 RepID=A0AAD7JQX3_9AGAR|nr:NADP-dependent oxidoreductase domain-containing protein [Mycena metata]
MSFSFIFGGFTHPVDSSYHIVGSGWRSNHLKRSTLTTAAGAVAAGEGFNGINTAYTAGRFRRFGLSNFTPADVQRVYNMCNEKGYPLPTVYQGTYSAVARKPEAELIPLLRKLRIALYIYSPISGGLVDLDFLFR